MISMLQISKLLDYEWSHWYSYLRILCYRHRFGLSNLPTTKYNSCKIIKLLHLDIVGHGDRSMKLFGGHKRCWNGQWLLTVRYFKSYSWESARISDYDVKTARDVRVHTCKSLSHKTSLITMMLNVRILTWRLFLTL